MKIIKKVEKKFLEFEFESNLLLNQNRNSYTNRNYISIPNLDFNCDNFSIFIFGSVEDALLEQFGGFQRRHISFLAAYRENFLKIYK